MLLILCFFFSFLVGGGGGEVGVSVKSNESQYIRLCCRVRINIFLECKNVCRYGAI